jgi:hypothetical protein
VEALPMPHPLVTGNPRYRLLPESEQRLLGYDWDNTVPGRPRLYLHWEIDGGYVTEVRDPQELPVPLPFTYGPWGLIQRDRVTLDPEQRYVPLGQGITWRGATPLPQPLDPQREALTLTSRFSASRPVLRDLIVSTRLVGYQQDGVHWAWFDLDDGVPALGAIPTLKWIAGSRVWDPHRLQVGSETFPGQTVGGIITLYDAFTGQTVPILDERIREAYLGIPLGLVAVGP